MIRAFEQGITRPNRWKSCFSRKWPESGHLWPFLTENLEFSIFRQKISRLFLAFYGFSGSRKTMPLSVCLYLVPVKSYEGFKICKIELLRLKNTIYCFFRPFCGIFGYLETDFWEFVGIFPRVSGSRKTMPLSILVDLSRLKS